MIKILEFLPLPLFFIVYKLHGVLAATATLVATSVFSVAIVAMSRRKLPFVFIASNAFVIVMGVLTLVTADSDFIKIKPTILYGLFALIIMGGFAVNKAPLKAIFGRFYSLDDAQWRIFSLQWLCFLLSAGAANEILWRFCSENTWVNFKVLAMPLIIFCFVGLQMIWYKSYLNK